MHCCFWLTACALQPYLFSIHGIKSKEFSYDHHIHHYQVLSEGTLFILILWWTAAAVVAVPMHHAPNKFPRYLNIFIISINQLDSTYPIYPRQHDGGIMNEFHISDWLLRAGEVPPTFPA
jgi:hypothetical protein